MDDQLNLNLTFLNDIYQNTSTGIDAINTIMPKVEDENLQKDLEMELHELRSVQVTAEKQLGEMGEKPDDIGGLQKAGMWMGIQMKSMMDKSTNHLAQMMIQGNDMGVIQLNRALNDNTEADTKIKSLAAQLIEIQKRTADTMKTYLHGEKE